MAVKEVQDLVKKNENRPLCGPEDILKGLCAWRRGLSGRSKGLYALISCELSGTEEIPASETRAETP